MAQKVAVLKQNLNDTKNFLCKRLSQGTPYVVIQDINTVDMTISLSIAVGHANNPTSYQGLAHLLEHMLFQGSQHYPAANTLVKTCHQFGGSVEALTSAEMMQINCRINIQTASTVIDIMTDMVSAPLLKQRQWFER